MKKLILVCILVVNVFSLNKIVIPNRATAGAVITASKTNENLDTIASKVNKLIDSLDAKFPRFTDYTSGDSTFEAVSGEIDTLIVDSSYLRTFTAATAGITATNIDTAHIRHATVDSATIPVFKGNETHRDSAYFARGIKAPRGYFALADIDSLVGSLIIEGTLNTGNGNNELYPMDQDVRTTASPTFAGMTFGTGDPLSVYDTGSFACSLFDGVTYRASVTAKYTIIGNVVHLSIPYMDGAITSSTNTKLRTIPAVIRPSTGALIATTTIESNSFLVVGRIEYLNATDYFLVRYGSGYYLDAGTGGLNHGVVGSYKFTYTLD